MQSVTAQHSLRVSEALNKSTVMLREMMKSSMMLQEKLLETDLKTQLIVINRDGKRSGKTEKTHSKLLQRPQAVMLIVSKSAHRLLALMHKQTKKVQSTLRFSQIFNLIQYLKIKSHLALIIQLSKNVGDNANVSIQP